MKILVLSFYFPPDLCAGSFRTGPLVEALAEQLPHGTIDVLTTLPNRYRSFSAEAPHLERRGHVKITRIPLPPHQSEFLDQSKAFLAFARAAWRETAGRKYDLVFATSSRLMTAVLGAGLAARTHAALFLDIRDIFVETISDVGPRRLSRVLAPAFSRMERWAIRRADAVNLVSRGFAPYFEERYPDRRFSYFTNGIDAEFLEAVSMPAVSPRRDHPCGPRVLYAGNIGESQGLHAILPALAERLRGRCRFQVVGDGGRKPALSREVAERGLANVELLDPVPRGRLLQLYSEADVLFLHLNDHRAFTRVLPSKVFEYAALGKPIWAGVAGYAADFLKSEVENCAVFPPCDAEAAAEAFASLRLETRPRREFMDRFSRERISRELAARVLATASERRPR